MNTEARELYLLVKNDQKTMKSLLYYAQKDFLKDTKFFLGVFVSQIASFARKYERENGNECFTGEDVFRVAAEIYSELTVDCS